jgi:hypothetical protein
MLTMRWRNAGLPVAQIGGRLAFLAASLGVVNAFALVLLVSGVLLGDARRDAKL